MHLESSLILEFYNHTLQFLHCKYTLCVSSLVVVETKAQCGHKTMAHEI